MDSGPMSGSLSEGGVRPRGRVRPSLPRRRPGRRQPAPRRRDLLYLVRCIVGGGARARRSTGYLRCLGTVLLQGQAPDY